MMFRCPTVREFDDKAKRTKEFIDSVIAWLNSKEMVELVKLFHGDYSYSKMALEEEISYLYDFASENWDYRKGKERFEIKEQLSDETNDYIIALVKGLGLIDAIANSTVPDYILVLGGARMANWDRVVMSERIWKNNRDANVVALSGFRRLNEIEIPYVEKYAPHAKTEIEAINAALEQVYDVKMECINSHEDDNPFLCSSIYKGSSKEKSIYTICAPSSEPELRRANSMDTFKEFVNLFDLKMGSNIIMVTSSIYVPYQLMKFAPIAIEYGINVDIIGVDKDIINNVSRKNAVLYIQEIKATIEAIYYYIEEQK